MTSDYSEFLEGLTAQVLDTFHRARSAVTLSVKEKHDYVTNVDESIERKVIDLISAEFPEHQVLGEESVSGQIEFSRSTWLIDPLDGTSNFILGIPFYGFSIAFVQDRQVKIGLIIDLVRDEVFTAYRGGGAYLNGEKLQVAESDSDLIGVSSGFLEQIARQNKPETLINLREYGKFRLLGSQALHLCYVASGRFKACINYEAKAWDDIAGALIVQEAGGAYFSHAGFDISQLGAIESEVNLYSVASRDELSIVRELISGVELKSV